MKFQKKRRKFNLCITKVIVVFIHSFKLIPYFSIPSQMSLPPPSSSSDDAKSDITAELRGIVNGIISTLDKDATDVEVARLICIAFNRTIYRNYSARINGVKSIMYNDGTWRFVIFGLLSWLQKHHSKYGQFNTPVFNAIASFLDWSLGDGVIKLRSVEEYGILYGGKRHGDLTLLLFTPSSIDIDTSVRQIQELLLFGDARVVYNNALQICDMYCKFIDCYCGTEQLIFKYTKSRDSLYSICMLVAKMMCMIETIIEPRWAVVSNRMYRHLRFCWFTLNRCVIMKSDFVKQIRDCASNATLMEAVRKNKILMENAREHKKLMDAKKEKYEIPVELELPVGLQQALIDITNPTPVVQIKRRKGYTQEDEEEEAENQQSSSSSSAAVHYPPVKQNNHGSFSIHNNYDDEQLAKQSQGSGWNDATIASSSSSSSAAHDAHVSVVSLSAYKADPVNRVLEEEELKAPILPTLERSNSDSTNSVDAISDLDFDDTEEKYAGD